MNIGRKGIVASLAAAGAALFALACAEPGTSPAKLTPSGANRGFDNTGIGHTGLVRLCKATTSVGAPADQFNFDWSQSGDLTGSGTTPVAVGSCVDLLDNDQVDVLTTITENSTMPTGWAFDSIHVQGGLAPLGTESINGNSVTVFSGNDFGRIVTFWNTFTPPPPPGGCTFTKGYYRNHSTATADAIADLGGSISIGSTPTSITAAQAQAILNATPGKPGNVTFTSNNLLNLAQQLISAILNGGGGVIQSDIDAANAGFTLTIASGKLNLTSSLTDDEIGDLITPLDSFNNGNVTGFPHCAD